MVNPHSPSPEAEMTPLPKRAKREPNSTDFPPSGGDKVKSEATPRASTSGSTVRGPWTGEEYVQLFDHVMASLPRSKNFGAAVPNRSANQADLAWRYVVLPKCRKMLLEKGKPSH
ncbi:hypothetical protein CcaverHIS002_0500860 [Cutaneotrichosporon cavernicola]|uniref:Myb-like domain-containing protein n=1 Tax=Cutaneotrichosporon cavernicola TaxID=279322 RepID=A0AA48L7Y9_9TREE|nr:uncharacterized protein CcaverHIS019_0600860 [Cutaneotrichosporon cavernicola]BEI84685.1 hypothetical protein CcaverHIS002_0500860 [Cutaneotrichosporon cavernicola]BEI93627.1 hypothetical protein CcaverHIS019_0600860 [Cutaneotrichosporon cavernicola]BEJ01404.1 hypothetical protein CcaverHIS631_0600860 [Cutaneotrichosporon cavernicola]BEJ09171.1 hypothetical protein CcaverHIS641_0600860 [Cutaneotrichosporon cavernicola]